MTTRIDTNDRSYTEALDQMAPEIEALPATSVRPIRHDIYAACVIALGAEPNARTLRRKIVARFGEDAARCVDRLRATGLACAKAHALYLTSLHAADVEELAGRLNEIRAVFLLETQALINRGVMKSSVIGELIGGTSYKGIGLDVLQLGSALRHAWAEVASHTGVTMAELDEAEALAKLFATTLGENEVGTTPSPMGETRRRAYTLFVDNYGELRRYATYFHWETRDFDDVIPPLGSLRARDGKDDEAVLMPPVTPGSGPVPAPGLPGAPPFGPAQGS